MFIATNRNFHISLIRHHRSYTYSHIYSPTYLKGHLHIVQMYIQCTVNLSINTTTFLSQWFKFMYNYTCIYCKDHLREEKTRWREQNWERNFLLLLFCYLVLYWYKGMISIFCTCIYDASTFLYTSGLP